jgi:hypothetical protein
MSLLNNLYLAEHRPTEVQWCKTGASAVLLLSHPVAARRDEMSNRCLLVCCLAVLLVLPGDYRTDSSVVYLVSGWEFQFMDAHPTLQEVSWKFDRGQVVAYVNEEDVVVAKRGRGSGVTGRTAWEYIRDMLSLKVHPR